MQRGQIAVLPLVGRRAEDDSAWLGALLSRMLGEHLATAGVPIMAHNPLMEALRDGGYRLPLSAEDAAALRDDLKLRGLIHGHYVLDEEGKMLGFDLFVEAPGVPQVPLEASTPLDRYGRFVERVTLAVLEQLRARIGEDVRSAVTAVRRPKSFEALRQLASAYSAWSRGQNELALAALSSALALDADYEPAAALQVSIARSADDVDTARSAFQRWIDIARREGRDEDAAERLLMLGHWQLARGKWDEARRSYEDARGIYNRIEDEQGKLRAFNNLANIALMQGKYQNAIQVYRRNLRGLEDQELTGTRDGAVALFNVSVAHKELGQAEEAMKAMDEALALARRLGDPALEARCLAQRGAIFDDMGRWQRASSDYEQAQQLFDVLGDKRGIAQVQSQQAVLLKQQGEYTRAEPMMQQAMRAFEAAGEPHEQALIWYNLADLYLAMESYDRAWTFAERARDAFRHLESGLVENAETLIETLESLPDEEEEAEAPIEHEAPGTGESAPPTGSASTPQAPTTGGTFGSSQGDRPAYTPPQVFRPGGTPPADDDEDDDPLNPGW